MTPPRSTAIIGLGLIGGSLARDLAAGGQVVIAYDTDPNVVAAAIGDGIVQNGMGPSLEGVFGADLVVIATPVDAALSTLERLVPHLAHGTVVTDVGSVKRPIEQRARQLAIDERFVGSHPFAGDHRSGWPASRRTLFSGVPVFLCAGRSTSQAAVEAVDDLWSGIGAVTESMTAAEHDRRMAWLSHLPQIASSVLAEAMRSSGHTAAELGPGGRDATRLAASSPGMWSAISLANADNISLALAELQAILGTMREAIDKGDADALTDFYERARSWLT